VALSTCRAKYNYTPSQQDDIGLAAKELMYLLVERADGWSQALNLHGQVGFVPSSYVEPVSDEEALPFAPGRVLTLQRSAADQPLGMSLAGSSPVFVDDVSLDGHGGGGAR
jgi:hypothetical protein